MPLEKILTPSRLTDEEAWQFAEIGLSSLHWFCIFVCGHDRLTPLGGTHDEFCRQIEACARPQLHLKYRGYYKSTILERDQPLWRAVRDPENFDCLLLVDDEQLGLSHLSTIARQVEHNPTFRRLYPDIKAERGSWGTGSYRITSRDVALEGPTWGMRTTRQKSTGRHVSQIIIADWVNEQNWRSIAEQKRLKDHLDSIWPTLDTDMLYLDGTRWADYDFWGYCIERLYPAYLDLFMQPIRGRAYLDAERKHVWEDDGVFVDPWKWDDDKWEATKKRVSNPALMAAQYTLDPRPRDAASFDPEWIQRIVAPALPPMTWYLAGDPASGDGSSRPALALAGVDEQDNYYLARCEYIEGLEAEFIDAFFVWALSPRWPPLFCGLERYGHGGHTCYQSLEARMRETRQYLNLEPMTSSRDDKDTRIRGVLWPLYSRRRVFHLIDLAGSDFEDELDAFSPRSAAKDCCDAAAWALTLAQKYGYRGPTSEPQPAAAPSDPLGVPRGYTRDEMLRETVPEEAFREDSAGWL